jgi:hypothetical protein
MPLVQEPTSLSHSIEILKSMLDEQDSVSSTAPTAASVTATSTAKPEAEAAIEIAVTAPSTPEEVINSVGFQNAGKAPALGMCGSFLLSSTSTSPLNMDPTIAPFPFTFVARSLPLASPQRADSLATLVGSTCGSKLSPFNIHISNSGSLNSTPCGSFSSPGFIFPGSATRPSFGLTASPEVLTPPQVLPLHDLMSKHLDNGVHQGIDFDSAAAYQHQGAMKTSHPLSSLVNPLNKTAFASWAGMDPPYVA